MQISQATRSVVFLVMGLPLFLGGVLGEAFLGVTIPLYFDAFLLLNVAVFRHSLWLWILLYAALCAMLLIRYAVCKAAFDKAQRMNEESSMSSSGRGSQQLSSLSSHSSVFGGESL